MYELISRISNLFKNYGIKSITMDDIASKIGMSKKTLYQHFKNKNDVILKVVQFEQKNECDELDTIVSTNTNAIDQLLNISKYISGTLSSLNPSLAYDLNKYYPHIWKKLINQRQKYILILINQNFKSGIQQDVYRKDINTDIIISVFYTFMLDIKGLIMYEIGLRDDFDKIFNTLFIYHIRGIANNNGITYIEDLYNSQKHGNY